MHLARRWWACKIFTSTVDCLRSLAHKESGIGQTLSLEFKALLEFKVLLRAEQRVVLEFSPVCQFLAAAPVSMGEHL